MKPLISSFLRERFRPLKKNASLVQRWIGEGFVEERAEDPADGGPRLEPDFADEIAPHDREIFFGEREAGIEIHSYFISHRIDILCFFWVECAEDGERILPLIVAREAGETSPLLRALELGKRGGGADQKRDAAHLITRRAKLAEKGLGRLGTRTCIGVEASEKRGEADTELGLEPIHRRERFRKCRSSLCGIRPELRVDRPKNSGSGHDLECDGRTARFQRLLPLISDPLSTHFRKNIE